MDRRKFLQYACSACANVALPAARLSAEEMKSSGWRTFEVTTHVEVPASRGTTRVWLPSGLTTQSSFQRTVSTEFSADGGKAGLIERKADGLGIILAEFQAGVRPVVRLTNRVATKDYVVDLSAPGYAAVAENAALDYFKRPTRTLPLDGIVRATALEITKGAGGDLEKARAIYDWIVDNTFRDPKVRGCGTGDIRYMLESWDLGGKCADLNALYVGLARAAGLPARDVYGIRTAKSHLGYESLGTSSQDITRAQHCRAQVYIRSHGWVPVDPADVRKVMLEEPPGKRPLDDALVTKTRDRLFGSWEMNWMAYNFASDVLLPKSDGPPLKFLMYPQAEIGDTRIDCLDPVNFKYEITSHEI